MEWARLNVFQRVTRHWDAIHPYNAGQAMKLAGNPDLDRLAREYESTLRELGLGRARHQDGWFRWEQLNGSFDPRILQSDCFDTLMTDELNRRFDESGELPFRPFVIRGDGHYYAGVIYHHWVADSFSIRTILREWFLRLHEPRSARRTALRLAQRGYWSYFGPDKVRWKLEEGFLEAFRWNARFRRARRVPLEGFGDFHSHFSLHHAPDGLISDVVRAAKRRGLTVNDVFVAALAEVCLTVLPAKLTDKRPDLALGSIVNLRGQSRESMDDLFGLFLGGTSVFCRANDLRNWESILKSVHRQHSLQKASNAAAASMVRMFAALVTIRLLSHKTLMEFYRKRTAMAGGISNVNLTREWPAKFHPAPLLDYLRISPSGPLLPLVFTPTTLGSKFNFGLTCRDSVIPKSDAARLAKMFVTRLERFASEG